MAEGLKLKISLESVLNSIKKFFSTAVILLADIFFFLSQFNVRVTDNNVIFIVGLIVTLCNPDELNRNNLYWVRVLKTNWTVNGKLT